MLICFETAGKFNAQLTFLNLTLLTATVKASGPYIFKEKNNTDLFNMYTCRKANRAESPGILSLINQTENYTSKIVKLYKAEENTEVAQCEKLQTAALFFLAK